MHAGKVAGFLAVMAVGTWLVWGRGAATLDDFTPRSGKVLLVHLPGGDAALITELARRGLLPAFQELLDRGRVVDLVEMDAGIQFPPGIFPAKDATTIATGQLAMFHRISYSMVPLAGRPGNAPITSVHRDRATLWDVLGYYGLRSAIVGWYATWPAEWVEGYLLSDRWFLDRFGAGLHGDYGHPDAAPVPDSYRHGAAFLTVPDDLGRELAPVLERRPPPAFVESLRSLRGQEQDEQVRHHLEMLLGAAETDAAVTAAAEELLDRDPSLRLVALPLSAVDVASHAFWMHAFPQAWQNHSDFRIRGRVRTPAVVRYETMVRDALVAVDGQIGSLLRQMGPETACFVVSGYRFRPDYGKTRSYSLNGVLERLGLVARTPEGEVDWSRTTCFDRDLEPQYVFRSLALNLAGSFPGGMLDLAGSEAIDAKWEEVVEQLKAVKVRPAWKSPENGKSLNTIYWGGRPLETGLELNLANNFADNTVVTFPDGREEPLDRVFPLFPYSGRHEGLGFALVSLPGDAGRHAHGVRAPLGAETGQQSGVMPTILAWLGLPLATAEGGMLNNAFLWMFEIDEAQRAAVRVVPSYEPFLGRKDASTELGRRYQVLRHALEEQGYLGLPDP